MIAVGFLLGAICTGLVCWWRLRTLSLELEAATIANRDLSRALQHPATEEEATCFSATS